MYPCPCCGYKTMEKPAEVSHEICPVCLWEGDPVVLDHPDHSGGVNDVSLTQAQKNFEKFGACEAQMKPHVRKPLDSEVRDEGWKPLDK